MFGFDDALALANTKAGAALAKGVGDAISGGGPVVSGAPIDARSFMDGAGWTVSTGRAKAIGGTVSQDREDSPVLGSASSAMQATMGGPLGMLLLGGLAFVMWRRAK